jgi:hypothetical protein
MYSGSLRTESKKVRVPRAAVRDDKKKGLQRDAVSPDFRFERTFFQAVGLAVVPRHLRHHYLGHLIVLTIPLRTIPCGIVSREEWLRVYTPTTKNCAELRKTPFAKILHRCSDACHRGRRGASACVWSTKVHIRIHWTCNQEVCRRLKLIMTSLCKVYFSQFYILYCAIWQHVSTWKGHLQASGIKYIKGISYPGCW